MARALDDTVLGKPRAATGSSPGPRVRDYLVGERIAEGGFGAVYAVEHAVLGRRAALKVLHAELASSPEAVARFEREARTVNLIRHPNVVDIYDFGELPDGRPYFVMEHLAGRDLAEHLASFGPLSLDHTLAILAPLADALTAAHAKGVVHRDVKPSNVFLTDGEPRRVVLLDFGVAKLVEPGVEGLTTSRHRIGTPSCMAPEQLAGHEVDGRADVYALGGLAYQMLTNQLPFGEPSPAVLLHLHAHARRPRPSDHVPVDEAVDRAVMTAMAVRPEDRFADPSAFVHALERAAATRRRQDVQTGRAIAIHLDVRVDPHVLEDPDDALLDDLDAALALALAGEVDARLTVTAQTGTSVLLTRVLPPDEPSARQARAEGLDAARRLAAGLASRPSRDPRVRYTVAVHVDQVLVVAGAIRGGELTRLARWVPDLACDGVVATEAAIDGVLDAPALDSHPRLRRLG